MNVVALHALKGGVGKTTAAVNLAWLAAADGWRTLVCDLDPQAAASFYLNVEPTEVSASRVVKGGSKLERAIETTDYAGLDVLPGGIGYRNIAVALSEAKKSRKQLRTTIREFSNYDLIFVDSGPGLDLETEAIFRASDLVLVPLVPTTLSVNSLRLEQSFIAKMSKRPRLHAFFSMVDMRRKLHRSLLEELARDPLMLSAVVPNSSQVEQMGLSRSPLVARHRTGKAVASFHALWDAVRDQLGTVAHPSVNRPGFPGDTKL